MTGRRDSSMLNGNAIVHANRHVTPTLPPTPAGLSSQELKRRHIFAAIIHSENSYVATLQRLVNVRFYFFYHLTIPPLFSVLLLIFR